ncbi:probable Na(+)/H(+) antiporter nhx-9 isoform X2 [Aphidius gifuensis]|uniref:probable Na(+)/H(+) antiporter nhx-9 isoform X2 n=1 Tax=Aphidius gifuensis TaxID=684658 RepID=UPI001CDCAF54|nr:probable Na(+)/H(+) antiporter nhx-9 isoform X2 [Aphidius gifuensis]
MAYPGKYIIFLILLLMSLYNVTLSRSYEKRKIINDNGIGDNQDLSMHGPSVDEQALPNDLRVPYPGKKFGPMGPIDRTFPDDTLRSLENNKNIDNQNLDKQSDSDKPLRQYQVFHVEFHRVETPFVIGIWIFFASIAKIGFHMAPKLSKMFPESCLLIVVGVVIGVLLFHANAVHVSPLTPDTFFLYMLPPIILDAGYFMPNRLFFDHLGTILLFAVLGTIFNTLSIGASLWVLGKVGLFGCTTPLLDMFLFSALISAVDPVAVLAVFEEIHVNEILYIVVFGESLLNDAVTVVLYHMFETYSEMGVSRVTYTEILSGLASFIVVAIGGTVIGILWGLATGFVTRFTYQVRVIEPIFIFIMAYLSYLNAELFHMSGILAITFCGITMKNYVEANISHKSHTTVKYTMKMLSSSSETIIFMFLGVATVNNDHVWNTWFVVMTIIFCSVYRILGVMVLTAVANRFRLHRLDKVEKFVMSYGGLRGAVAFALVLLIDKKHVPLQPMFVTTTIAVIYFTVFIQGITIKPLVKILNVKRAERRKPTMNERIHERIMDHIMAGVEDILGKHGNYHLRDKFKRFDTKFIRPYLVRNHCGAEPKILETYSKLAMKDAIDYIRRNASTIGNISGTESMSAIFRNYSNTGNFNSSCSQLESGWNIDLQELEYYPSKKDLTEAKIHHLVAEELCKPYKRHRRLSYSRHAVDDRDLSTQVNYKMHMNIRRMKGEHKHRHKRSKKLIKDGKQNHVSFPEMQQQNGLTKLFSEDYIDGATYETELGPEVKPTNKDVDWDSAITFTARSSGTNFELLPNKKNFINRFTFKFTASQNINESNTDITDEDCDGRFVVSRRKRDESEGESYKVTTPTATETMLPWKRQDDCDSIKPLQQNEFPAWCSNKEYIAYSSPSATFLGGIEQPKAAESIIGLFAKQSVSSDIPDFQDSDETDQVSGMKFLDGHTSTKNLDETKSTRRRGSMMELNTVPVINESFNNGSHSLPEYWNTQRLRIQTSTFPCETTKAPNMSTVLISSSTESSDDYED